MLIGHLCDICVTLLHLLGSNAQFFCLFVCLAVLCLHCCVQAFSSCGERGLLFVAVRRLLIAVASLVTEHKL